jgi:hypothetical protein
MSAVINSTLLSRHGAHFRANLLPEKFPQLFAQSVTVNSLTAV